MSRLIWTALLTLVCLADPVLASPRLLATTETSALRGWMGFCEREPSECAVNAAEPEFVTLTDTTRELIKTVNKLVNHSVIPVSDQAHWNVVDQWDFPTDGYGDCEDYQLLKRKFLVEAGLPRRALRITVVIDETHAGHAVLMVRTTEGDLILDNRTDAVLRWSEISYDFVKRESANGVGWVLLEPESNRTVVAMAQ
jgi:predicted transglutaminase-like cysteine proteinase